MNPVTTRRGAIAAFACVGLAWSELARAEPISFSVPLSGAEQVPPVETSGAGTAQISYDPEARVVTWSIAYSGLSSPATMAHFHGPADAGANGPVTLWLTKKGAEVKSPIRGEAMLSAAQAEQFAAGQWYVNVHTKTHPDGEIRGQVKPPAD